MGCSPWGREESDTTERLPFHFSLSCVGEGNGNPLQCSCLENPRDGGAWWASVIDGVAQSRTQLSRRNLGLLLRCCSGQGPHLALTGDPRVFSRVARESWGLRSSHCRGQETSPSRVSGAAHQAPPSLGFSRQEHWSGLPFLRVGHD